MPSFGGGSIAIWTMGKWESQLLDVSLHSNTSDVWTALTWVEEGTTDETKAYVRVDILDSAKATLQTDISGLLANGRMSINLGDYANVVGVDMYVRFKLYAKTQTPIISDVVVT